MNRQQRAQIAQETLQIIEAGGYQLPDGRMVAISDELAIACAHTALHRPSDYDSIISHVEPAGAETSIAVSNSTTLAAGRRLATEYASVACLNFASAKNPGGGFLSGSQAQEESLARASGLYAALMTQPKFYDHHRKLGTSLYSDHVIFSPSVPVFRDDDDRLLEAPWVSCFITAAAVNAGAVQQNEPTHTAEIVPAMERRARMVLGVALKEKCEAIVLGAWGCGVFRNEPAVVAKIFGRVLNEPQFQQRFRHVEFAIYDPSPAQPTVAAFKRVFG